MEGLCIFWHLLQLIFYFVFILVSLSSVIQTFTFLVRLVARCFNFIFKFLIEYILIISFPLCNSSQNLLLPIHTALYFSLPWKNQNNKQKQDTITPYNNKNQTNHGVCFVLAKDSWEWGQPWLMVDIFSVTPLKKTDFPYPIASNCKLIITADN